MTIIAVKDGVIAADGGVFSGHNIDVANRRKIFRTRDGALCACAGQASVSVYFRNIFVNTGAAAERAPGRVMTSRLRELSGDEQFAAIWLETTGEIRRMGVNGVVTECGETMGALGTSEDFAVGAMRAGASAEQAVRLAIEHTIYAAGDVQVEYLGEPPQPVVNVVERPNAPLTPLADLVWAGEWSGPREEAPEDEADHQADFLRRQGLR